MTVTRILFALVFLHTSTAVVYAQAIVFSQKETRNGRTRQAELVLEANRLVLRADGIVTIFDSSKPVLYMVDPAKKTYTELNKTTFDEMQEEMVLRAMPKATPEQRKRALEATVRTAPAQVSAASGPYRKTGTDRVGERECVKYELAAPPSDGAVRITRQKDDVCIVPAEASGMRAADFAILRTYMEYMFSLLPGREPPGKQNEPFVAGVADGQPFSGVVLRRVWSGALGEDVTTENLQVRREAVPPATFEIPAGFRPDSLANFLTTAR